MATGNTYKDILKALRFLDGPVVTEPQFLAEELREFRRDNPSTKGSKLKHGSNR